MTVWVRVTCSILDSDGVCLPPTTVGRTVGYIVPMCTENMLLKQVGMEFNQNFTLGLLKRNQSSISHLTCLITGRQYE